MTDILGVGGYAFALGSIDHETTRLYNPAAEAVTTNCKSEGAPKERH